MPAYLRLRFLALVPKKCPSHDRGVDGPGVPLETHASGFFANPAGDAQKKANAALAARRCNEGAGTLMVKTGRVSSEPLSRQPFTVSLRCTDSFGSSILPREGSQNRPKLYPTIYSHAL